MLGLPYLLFNCHQVQLCGNIKCSLTYTVREFTLDHSCYGPFGSHLPPRVVCACIPRVGNGESCPIVGPIVVGLHPAAIFHHLPLHAALHLISPTSIVHHTSGVHACSHPPPRTVGVGYMHGHDWEIHAWAVTFICLACLPGIT